MWSEGAVHAATAGLCGALTSIFMKGVSDSSGFFFVVVVVVSVDFFSPNSTFSPNSSVSWRIVHSLFGESVDEDQFNVSHFLFKALLFLSSFPSFISFL